MSIDEKVYLGDSVYAEFSDGYHIKLTTEIGFGPSNVIYLEPEVMKNLIEYSKFIFDKIGEQRDGTR